MLGNTDDFLDETAGTVVSRGIEDGQSSTVERGYFEMSLDTKNSTLLVRIQYMVDVV